MDWARAVKVRGSLSELSGTLEGQRRPYALRLALDDGRTYQTEGSDYFACMMRLREQLESDGLMLCVQGARANVRQA
jgi:hypothetical protein